MWRSYHGNGPLESFFLLLISFGITVLYRRAGCKVNRPACVMHRGNGTIGGPLKLGSDRLDELSNYRITELLCSRSRYISHYAFNASNSYRVKLISTSRGADTDSARSLISVLRYAHGMDSLISSKHPQFNRDGSRRFGPAARLSYRRQAVEMEVRAERGNSRAQRDYYKIIAIHLVPRPERPRKGGDRVRVCRTTTMCSAPSVS